MKAILKLEELAMLIGCIILLIHLDVAWWYFFLLSLGPDISMLGYLVSNKIGAWSYNLFHHKGIAFLIGMMGYLFNIEILILSGIVLFSHASMDRVAGYGLKYENGFKFTHLGEIGKK